MQCTTDGDCNALQADPNSSYPRNGGAQLDVARSGGPTVNTSPRAELELQMRPCKPCWCAKTIVHKLQSSFTQSTQGSMAVAVAAPSTQRSPSPDETTVSMSPRHHLRALWQRGCLAAPLRGRCTCSFSCKPLVCLALAQVKCRGVTVRRKHGRPCDLRRVTSCENRNPLACRDHSDTRHHEPQPF